MEKNPNMLVIKYEFFDQTLEEYMVKKKETWSSMELFYIVKQGLDVI